MYKVPFDDPKIKTILGKPEYENITKRVKYPKEVEPAITPTVLDAKLKGLSLLDEKTLNAILEKTDEDKLSNFIFCVEPRHTDNHFKKEVQKGIKDKKEIGAIIKDATSSNIDEFNECLKEIEKTISRKRVDINAQNKMVFNGIINMLEASIL